MSIDRLEAQWHINIESSFTHLALPWRAVYIHSCVDIKNWLQCTLKLQSNNSHMTWHLKGLGVEVSVEVFLHT